jgi:hypothetical protein
MYHKHMYACIINTCMHVSSLCIHMLLHCHYCYYYTYICFGTYFGVHECECDEGDERDDERDEHITSDTAFVDLGTY